VCWYASRSTGVSWRNRVWPNKTVTSRHNEVERITISRRGTWFRMTVRIVGVVGSTTPPSSGLQRPRRGGNESEEKEPRGFMSVVTWLDSKCDRREEAGLGDSTLE
jgi:hypothetical protein